jgi:hypothetical protein
MSANSNSKIGASSADAIPPALKSIQATASAPDRLAIRTL